MGSYCSLANMASSVLRGGQEISYIHFFISRIYFDMFMMATSCVSLLSFWVGNAPGRILSSSTPPN